MENFIRTEKLIGKNNIEKLNKSNVIVFGVGGVGGYVSEGLIRAGVGNITLVDFDVVSESNINRQIIALYSTIGKSKVELMKQRMLDINPNAQITAIEQKIDLNNINDFDFSKYDYIVDAIDMVTSKIAIIQKAKEYNVPIISCMGTGNKLDTTKLQIADISKTHTCPLAKVMRKELRDRGITGVKVLFSTEEPAKVNLSTSGKAVPSSIVFVPAVAGLMIASFVVDELLD